MMVRAIQITSNDNLELDLKDERLGSSITSNGHGEAVVK